MGIDYGSKRIGIAISDEMGMIAYPKDVVSNGPRALDTIEELARKENIEAIVLGDSRNKDMEENAIMETAKPFAEELARRLAIPLHLELESFTTQGARDLSQSARDAHAGEGRPSRSPHTHAPHDASAAALVLQRFLERRDCQP
jgi:putative Holliday junction resolvase